MEKKGTLTNTQFSTQHSTAQNKTTLNTVQHYF